MILKISTKKNKLVAFEFNMTRITINHTIRSLEQKQQLHAT